jgi:uncharacterized membrane protein YciS (DUF1049 family)
MRRFIGSLLLLLVACAAIALALANRRGVSVNLYLAQFETPLALALAVAFSLGAVLGAMVMLPALLRLKTENLRLRRGLTRQARVQPSAAGTDAAP